MAPYADLVWNTWSISSHLGKCASANGCGWHRHDGDDSDDKNQDQSRYWPQINKKNITMKILNNKNPWKMVFVATHPAPQFHLQAVQKMKMPRAHQSTACQKKHHQAAISERNFPCKFPGPKCEKPTKFILFPNLRKSKFCRILTTKLSLLACLNTATDPLLIGGNLDWLPSL